VAGISRRYISLSKTHSGPRLADLANNILGGEIGAADAFEDITKQLLHVGLLRRHARDDDGLTVRISAVGARVAKGAVDADEVAAQTAALEMPTGKPFSFPRSGPSVSAS